MSFAIGCWVRDTVVIESQRSVEYSKHFLSAISTSKKEFSTTVAGMAGHKHTKEKLQNEAAKKYNEQYIALIKG